ncbi:MAG TPA: hypothetical protein PKL78_15040 [Anaerolineales bacterium]|nr:hypothetical protein [Anaerolineales bacterium]HNO32083.1 hypothetical protein [Anaerolineales bacterium]
MKKNIPTDQTPANIASVLAVLAESPARLERLAGSIHAETTAGQRRADSG